MALIKSHSKYVVKKKHQTLADGGVVYERDMSTVGALSEFPNGQTPIYRNGNFIISVNGSVSLGKEYDKTSWEKSASGEVWTMSNISAITSTQDDSTNIELKQDCYNLKDFAYYGSCSELIRSSLVDIVNKFPGELYAPTVKGEGIKVFTKQQGKLDGYGEDVWDRLGGDDYYLLDNPFNINIHEEFLSEEITSQNPLRYFANGGKDMFEINGSEITSWNVTRITTSCTHIADISINEIQIKAFLDHLGQCNYLVSKNTLGCSIRPKTTYLKAFFKGLDLFQKTLLNQNSTPKYSALFEVIDVADYGYSTKLQRFTFPLTYGGYNLGVNTQAYTNYVGSLSKIAELYDEIYSDNLYRTMTHESIKNFDWTQSSDEHEDYVMGGSKMQDTLRLIGRVFDEEKLYADSIGHVNQITYDGGNNLPDYFLTDSLDIEGWDIVNVFPFAENLSEDLTATTCAYITKQKPYFVKKSGNEEATTKFATYVYDENVNTKKAVHPRIKQYSSNKQYSMQEVNNHFMRMLKLNSKPIWRNKGTKNGIEMLLSLFGLKSSTFTSKVKNSRFWKAVNHQSGYSDFNITEYVLRTSGITDIDTISGFNQTKLITYKGEKTSFQGLPIRLFQNTTIFPYYSQNMEIDGQPYYQQNGGWLFKQYQMDKNDAVVNNMLTTTLKDVTSVDTIRDLFNIPYNKLHNKHIVEIRNTEKDYLIVDGVVYDVLKDDESLYINVIVNNGSVKVGRTTFVKSLQASSKNGSKTTYNLNEFRNNSYLRIYLINNQIVANNDGLTVNNQAYYSNGKLDGVDANNATPYFLLFDKKRKNTISGTGWRQLKKSDDEYKNLLITKNYYKGNNPHTSRLNTDLGGKYFESYAQLFKYAIDNNLIDRRCFQSDVAYYQAMDEMYNVGFSDLYQDGATTCEQLNLLESPKVHYFGNKFTKTDNVVFTEALTGSYVDDEMSWDFNCDVIDSIVNTKRVLMEFKSNIYDNTPRKLKYVDKVLFKYLEQLIPSNVITMIGNGEAVVTECEPICFSISAKTSPTRNGSEVELTAKLKSQRSTTLNGVTTTEDCDESDITNSVQWYCDGKEINSNKYTLIAKENQNVTYEFTGKYGSITNCTNNSSIFIEQKGYSSSTETWYEYIVLPTNKKIDVTGGTITLNATLYEKKTDEVNGSTTKETPITNKVEWWVNGDKISIEGNKYKIGENTLTSDRSFTFEAKYGDVKCYSVPQTVTQAAAEKPEDVITYYYTVSPTNINVTGGTVTLDAYKTVNGASTKITSDCTWSYTHNGNTTTLGKITNYTFNENTDTNEKVYVFSALYNNVSWDNQPIRVTQEGASVSSVKTFTFGIKEGDKVSSAVTLPSSGGTVILTATSKEIRYVNGTYETPITADVTTQVTWYLDETSKGSNRNKLDIPKNTNTKWSDITLRLSNDTMQENDDGASNLGCEGGDTNHSVVIAEMSQSSTCYTQTYQIRAEYDGYEPTNDNAVVIVNKAEDEVRNINYHSFDIVQYGKWWCESTSVTRKAYLSVEYDKNSYQFIFHVNAPKDTPYGEYKDVFKFEYAGPYGECETEMTIKCIIDENCQDQ